MQRIRIIIGALLLVLLTGCHGLRDRLRNDRETFYFDQVVWSLQEIPDDTKAKCGYDYEVPYPVFVETETPATDLESRIVINYNPHEMEKIRHDAVHYMNRMKRTNADGGPLVYVSKRENVSWECLDEITALMITENLMLRDQLGIQRVRTMRSQHRASEPTLSNQ